MWLEYPNENVFKNIALVTLVFVKEFPFDQWKNSSRLLSWKLSWF